MKLKDKNLFTIGQVAEKTGVSRRMIRHYEKLGFLIDVKRAKNGYRLYNKEHVRVVRKIPEFLLLGFTLEEVLLTWKVKQVFLHKRNPEKHLKALVKDPQELTKLKNKVHRILETNKKYIDYMKRVVRFMDRIEIDKRKYK